MSDRWRLEGRGSDLGLVVSGPDLAACLAAAVEAFAAAVGDVEAGAARAAERVRIPGGSPEELLVGLLDEAVLRLDADGQLAVALDEVAVDDEGLTATLHTVDLAAVTPTGPAPKAATWHEVRLAPAGDGWQGQVMLDL